MPCNGTYNSVLTASSGPVDMTGAVLVTLLAQDNGSLSGSVNVSNGAYIFTATDADLPSSFAVRIDYANGSHTDHVEILYCDDILTTDDVFVIEECPCQCPESPVLDGVIDGDDSYTGIVDMAVGVVVYAEKIDTVTGVPVALGSSVVQANGTFRIDIDPVTCGFNGRVYVLCDNKKVYSNVVVVKKAVCCTDCGCGGSGCGTCGSNEPPKCYINYVSHELVSKLVDADGKIQVKSVNYDVIRDMRYSLDRMVWQKLDEIGKFDPDVYPILWAREKGKKGCDIRIQTNTAFVKPFLCAMPKMATQIMLSVAVGDNIDTSITIKDATKLVGIDGLVPGVTVVYEGITQSGPDLIVPIKGTAAVSGTYKPKAKATNLCDAPNAVAQTNMCMEVGEIIAVAQTCPLPIIAKKLTASMTVGEQYSDTIIVNNATSVSVVGLPAGLSANSTDNNGTVIVTVSGNPTAGGNYEAKVNAKNSCSGCRIPSEANGLDGGSGKVNPADVAPTQMPTQPVYLLTDPETGTMYALCKNVPQSPNWFGKVQGAASFSDFDVSPCFYDPDRWGGSYMGNLGMANAASQYEFKIGASGSVFKYKKAFAKTYDPITTKGLGSITIGRELDASGNPLSSATIVVTLCDNWAIGGSGYPFTVKVKQGGTVIGSFTQSTDANGSINSRPELAEVIASIGNGNYTVEVTYPDNTTRSEVITIA